MNDSSDKPNILLLISDTLRPDFLSCYGGQTTTPTMDKLAAEGSIFEQAYAAGPGTAISHAAIFSGQYPSETGIVGQTDIPEDIPLIAEHLRNEGYDTFGIPGPGRMGSEWGYDRGFDKYFEAFTDDKPSYTSPEFLRDVATDPTLRWPLLHDFARNFHRGNDKLTSFKFDLLAEQSERNLEQPFFAMMNTTIVHNPYDPPRPYKENATPELERPSWYILEYLFDTEETLERDDVRPERIYEAQTTEGIAKYLADPDYLTEAELEVLRTWYRASIEYLDDQLSGLISRLDRNGFLDDTVLMLTSDHGEYFGEHGLIAHSHYLYKQVTHVPLIITGPNIPTTRRDDLVSLVDLFATICDIAAVEPPNEISSKSLFGSGSKDAVYSEYGIRHQNRTGHRKYMSENQLEEFGVGRKTIRTTDYRYEYTSNGEELLYRRPAEKKIEDPDNDVLRGLREQLFEKLGDEFESTYEKREISDEIEDNLRKLGYIE